MTARIADDLHIADDTVKSRLHHAMRALRLTLQDMGVTGFDRNEGCWPRPMTLTYPAAQFCSCRT
jgi:hypothetical protein